MGPGRNSRLVQRDILRRLRFESLEPRRVMAGNVTAEVIEGNLFITGDEAANVIRLSRNAAGDYVVEDDQVWHNVRNWPPGATGGSLGYMVLADSTTVNHVADDAVFAGVTGDIIIRGGDGDDRILIGQSAEADPASRTLFTLSGDLMIEGESGQDTAAIGSTTGFFENPDSFSEPVFAVETAIGGHLTIDMGADGGSAFMRNTGVGGDLSIDVTGSIAAMAQLHLFSVDAGSMRIIGSDTVDQIKLSLVQVTGNVMIDAGAGRDEVAVYGDIGDELIVSGGAQPDIIHLGGSFTPLVLSPIRATFGEAASTPQADPLRIMEQGAGGPLVVGGNLWVNSDGGDFVNVQNTVSRVWLRINSHNTATPEYVRIRNVSAPTISLDLRGGDDIADVAFVTATESFHADLGTGNDTLNAAIVAFDGTTRTISNGDFSSLMVVASFDGGDGVDSLRFDGCRFSAFSSFDLGSGDDRLTLAACVLLDPNTKVETGDGADRFRIEFSSATKMTIDTGAGDDAVEAHVAALDQFFVSLGEGDDLFDLRGCVVRQSSDADGGAGFDTLNRLHSRIKQFNATNFEAGNDAGLLIS